MFIPQKDERVLVCPANPNEAVQRGPNTFGQFLHNGWQEVLFNDFLHHRVLDGSVFVKPIPKSEPADIPAAEPVFLTPIISLALPDSIQSEDL